MTNTTTHPLTLTDLRDLNACHAALRWAAKQPNMETAWRTCERADWLIWALAACNADPKQLRLMAADIAEAVLPVWEAQHPEDDRPREAIEAARAFTRGETTEEARAALVAARAAGAAAARAAGAAAARAAAEATWAAAGAAATRAAAEAAWAATGAAAAARATAEAAWATMAAVDIAAIVRRHFPDLPTITETTGRSQHDPSCWCSRCITIEPIGI